ncbi:Ion-translocating oxidoreductase complex subunit D [Vibrio stylophorae]|uniref:Ion-translocating oxidoreductase complex subunit D n=1 Tax=Vibrio stylophorae TaxID=659351 RepID=A0ABM8ZRY9_9VIBR|nr:electron transport complex subunit RsxD [Vibrio stylophorae]CAH0533065.1 Ion-translocating oxidoreductase complex subunit D [Vibrio stylophorae]
MFYRASSPHARSKMRTSTLMLTVVLCALPGIAAQVYGFGYGNLIQIGLAIASCLFFEAFCIALRRRPMLRTLKDNSALLTGLLIGIAVPPLAPWWIVVIGSFFAIVIAKQLYGGLGQNLLNPAMVAYVVLLISFPVQMTTWLPAKSIMLEPLSFADVLSTIFSGFTHDGFSANQLRLAVDGSTMATPLDTLKTGFTTGADRYTLMQSHVFSGLAGRGWQWVNLGFLLGGLIMIWRRAIAWHIPVAMLSTLALCALMGDLIAPAHQAGLWVHLLSGATMLGAFFIATDPVSASTTNKGRLIYGALIGLLVYLIRSFGGFPDGVAFAVLLANLTVPLIDTYTKPRTYGHGASQ